MSAINLVILYEHQKLNIFQGEKNIVTEDYTIEKRFKLADYPVTEILRNHGKLPGEYSSKSYLDLLGEAGNATILSKRLNLIFKPNEHYTSIVAKVKRKIDGQYVNVFLVCDSHFYLAGTSSPADLLKIPGSGKVFSFDDNTTIERELASSIFTKDIVFKVKINAIGEAGSIPNKFRLKEYDFSTLYFERCEFDIQLQITIPIPWGALGGSDDTGGNDADDSDLNYKKESRRNHNNFPYFLIFFFILLIVLFYILKSRASF